MTHKDMTDTGVVRSLGDYLGGCIRDSVAEYADQLLETGMINREERLALSGAADKAASAFIDSVGADMAGRMIDVYGDSMASAPMADQPMMMSMGKVVKAMGSILEKLGWAVEQKETFDNSPWNGDASQWPTAAAYCADCLIDENSGGGEKTKEKCHLPYRKPGSNKINRNALRAMASGARGISALKGVSSEAKTKAAKWAVSHWQAAFDRPAPDSMYHMAGMTPPKAGGKSSTVFYKDAAGDWRVVLMYSNKWEDREKDIIASAAHKEYAEWIEKSGFKPPIVLFHQPDLSDAFWLKVYKTYGDDTAKLQEVVNKVYQETGAAIGEAERVAYVNGFALMLGKVYPEKVAVAERLAKMEDLGNSHVFVTTDFSRNENGGMIVNKYRSFEGTILPRERAANRLTLPILKEKSMEAKAKLTDQDKAWLGQVLGESEAKSFLDSTADLETRLDAVLAFKSMTEDEEAVVENKEESVTLTVPVDSKAIAAEVMQALNVTELQAVLGRLQDGQTALAAKLSKIEALEAEITRLKQGDDEKVAALFRPVSWSKSESPAQSEKTVIADQDEAKKKVEETAPKQEGADKGVGADGNPLGFGFWDKMLAPSTRQP